jgi:2-oxoglutarate ferredoxin oxidoreductase subunit alpha
MPKNTAEVLRSFRRVLIPEMNLGQLKARIRAQYLVDAVGYPKVQGRPFMVTEIESRIEELISNGKTT